MSGRFVTYAENMCALIWLSVVSDLGTFQQFRNSQALGRPHLESPGEPRSKILSKDKRHEGIVERGATAAWLPESWDYHASPTVVRKRGHTLEVTVPILPHPGGVVYVRLGQARRKCEHRVRSWASFLDIVGEGTPRRVQSLWTSFMP